MRCTYLAPNTRVGNHGLPTRARLPTERTPHALSVIGRAIDIVVVVVVRIKLPDEARAAEDMPTGFIVVPPLRTASILLAIIGPAVVEHHGIEHGSLADRAVEILVVGFHLVQQLLHSVPTKVRKRRWQARQSQSHRFGRRQL